jgi:hypothetical protein
MVITDALFFDLCTNSTCGVFFLNAAEIVVDSLDLSLSGGMPALDDLHGLCDVVVEGQNFLKLPN